MFIIKYQMVKYVYQVKLYFSAFTQIRVYILVMEKHLNLLIT